jgi:glycosyltransferase involved in cell wall biosynthesis
MVDRPLRVAVDARCLNTSHVRGMGKSLFELVRRTSAAGTVRWHLFGDRPDRPVLSPAPGTEFSAFDMPGYRFHLWEQLGFPLKARRVHADVVHAPATVMPWWQPAPTVVTIHDVIPWTGRDPALGEGFYRDRLLPAAYARASAVLTISETSRRDIASQWPRLEPKMHVVPPGVDERYLCSAASAAPIVVNNRTIDGPYLLYFGGGDPRKRLEWALNVWRNVTPQNVSLLVCGLETSSHDRVRQSVPPELRERLIIAPFVPEAAMPQLYMRAAAVLYPTLYEGFGLPAVEAQAVGTPVLFSDVGSLSELKGPAAHVLPVEDMGAWIAMASALVRERGDAPRPNDAARFWARQFSWDVYAQRTVAVYRAVAARGRKAAHESTPSLDRLAS